MCAMTLSERIRDKSMDAATLPTGSPPPSRRCDRTRTRPVVSPGCHDPIELGPMANIKSQIKRNRQNEKRRVRNKAVRSELKTRTKLALTSAEQGTEQA